MKKQLIALSALSSMALAAKDSRPNILLIVSEDNGQEISCYGDKNVKTPNIDKLASQGMMFNNGYVSQAVCSPSRSTIFTGLYPHQNGHIGLATHKYAFFKKFPTTYSVLKQAGYTTGLLGKTHVNPESVVEKYVDFRKIKGSNFAKRNLAAYAKESKAFFDQAGDKPFFMTVNYPDAHHPLQNQVQGRPKKVLQPSDVGTIPYIGYDNKRMHEIVTAYYNCMVRLDECIGELMTALEESGKADNTFVIYIGDHGAQLPRGKIFATEAGMKVPYIVKWPENIKPGTISEKLVSTIDFLPTFADLAGVEAPANLPGLSLVPMVTGKTEDWRETLAYERNSDAINLYYPQRSIRNDRYKLTWSPLAVKGINDRGAHDYVNQKKWKKCSFTKEEVEGMDEKNRALYEHWLNPPEFQLYDLKKDEWEFNDLASNPEYKSVLKQMKKELKKWMVETNDWAQSPKMLDKLTEENMSVVKAKRGKYPKGGWQYLKFLDPSQDFSKKK